MRLAELGERRIVEVLLRTFDRGLVPGLGDDCGVLPWGDHYLLATTDVMNPATHMPPGATPDQLGEALVATNLSDVAAMGGEALGFLLALSLPRTTELAFVQGLAAGVESACRAYDVAVLGGDTKEAAEVSLAGTALGRVPKAELLLRSGASAGDLLVVTGQLGRAGWAVDHLGEDDSQRPKALELLLRPTPRLAEGRFLAASRRATSCMDVSDGVGTTLAQMAAASGVAYEVSLEALPIDPLLGDLPLEARIERALYRGGDYELLATVAAEGAEEVLARAAERRIDLTVIGKATAARGGNRLVTNDGAVPLEGRGYLHFAP